MNIKQFNDWLSIDHKQSLIMGILNVTPDSFSDGGLYFDKNAAIEHALEMIENGADIIDIGGESTRPFSDPVSLDEEISRVIPVIEGIREKSDVCISIDTTKSIVANKLIRKNEIFTTKNLAVKRPGYGISPIHFEKLLGLKSNKKYIEDEMIKIKKFKT